MFRYIFFISLLVMSAIVTSVEGNNDTSTTAAPSGSSSIFVSLPAIFTALCMIAVVLQR